MRDSAASSFTPAQNDTRIDPLRLYSRTVGPPPAMAPAALPFDTAPSTEPPWTWTELDPLVASSVTPTRRSNAISTAPDPAETSHPARGVPDTLVCPLSVFVTRPPRTPVSVMALDDVCTSTSPGPAKAA